MRRPLIDRAESVHHSHSSPAYGYAGGTNGHSHSSPSHGYAGGTNGHADSPTPYGYACAADRIPCATDEHACSNPKQHPGDRLMASWFARTAAERAERGEGAYSRRVGVRMIG